GRRHSSDWQAHSPTSRRRQSRSRTRLSPKNANPTSQCSRWSPDLSPDWPLQIRLSVGSRVPLHCTASGKLFLALSPPSLSQALLRLKSLPRHTGRTLTDPAKLAAELNRIRQTQIGTDNEEFIEGMAAAAVPV